MATLFDYCAWRGDLSFTQAPFGDLDALALSAVCYLDCGNAASTDSGLTLSELAAKVPLLPSYNKSYEKNRVLLLRAMAGTARFGGIRLSRFVNIVDAAHGIQFSALTCDVGQTGRVVCFRGTDATLVGWRENFVMAYECPVPAQRAACFYLERVAAGTDAPLILLGHSKGGNLAVYAAVCADPALQGRIRNVWSFDSPGLTEEVLDSPGYRRILPRIRAFIPQSSVIGLLMGSHPDPVIVQSNAVGLQQHDVFTWLIAPPGGFETAEETTFSSQVIDRSLHDWLKTATPGQRRTFVDAVFSVMESTGAATTAEMKASVLTRLPAMLQTANSFDAETRNMLLRLAGRFVTLATANAVDVGTNSLLSQTTASVVRLIQGGRPEGNGRPDKEE